jgi:hypothetical protein
MHFHSGWSWHVEGFDHRVYYTRDSNYGSVGHQQDMKASRQENQIVRNAKLNHPVSPKVIAASGQQHKQWVPQGVSSVDGLGGNQDQIGLRSETSADDKAKHDTKKGLEEVASKQNKTQGKETNIKTEAVASSQQQPNWTVRFGKPDHPISSGSVQKGALKSIVPGTTLALRWCPPGLTPSQRRRIQRLRAQKLKEEATEKERDEHFNAIWPMFLTKQEWRVKEKTNTPTLMASDDGIDLLDDDESPLIKDGSPPATGMDINMVFTLPAEFRGVE